MDEKVAATKEEMATTPQKEDRDTKTGRAGQGSPLDDALILKIHLAVANQPVDFALPDVHGD